MTKTNLDKLLPTITDSRKLKNYPLAIDAYKKWWGRKSLSWFVPPNAIYSRQGVDISVNPELGLEINGQPHLIKLYFKADPLARNRVQVFIRLMKKRLQKRSPKGTIMGVMDVRRSKLIVQTRPNPNLDAMLDAEMVYIATIFPNLK